MAPTPAISVTKFQMRTTTKEVSTTGGVAGYNTPIGAAGNPTPEELKRWKKEKRKLLDKGKKKRAKPFVKDEQKNIDERAHQMIRDTILIFFQSKVQAKRE